MPTTSTLPRPDDTTPSPEPAPHRLRISATQLIASALAAVTATVAASYLGVSGTVIGAAVASVVTVLGNTIYSHSIRQTGNRVRTVVPAGVRWAPSASGLDPAPLPVGPRPRREREKATSLRVLAAACAGVFAAVLVLVTAVELVAGEPLSDLLRGRSGTGTSLGGGGATHRAQNDSTPSTPQPTVTVTAHVVTTTPTVTVTAPPVTATTTPTVTPTTAPTPSAPVTTPTPAPTPTVQPSP